MGKMYIIADLKLFDTDTIVTLGYDDYKAFHSYVIHSWNSCVKPDDDVIIMGDIIGSCEDMEFASVKNIAAVVNKLNGTLWLTSKDAKDKFTKEEWKEIGIDHVWSVPLFKVFDNGEEAYYPIQPIKVMEVYERQYKVLVVDHNNPVEGMTKGIMLSADAAKWGYCPLDTDNLIELHKNMQEFESMDSGEEHRSDIEEGTSNG